MNAQTCSRPRAGIHTTIMGQIANRTCLWQRSVRRTDMQVYMPVQVQIYMPRRRSGRPPTSTNGDSSPGAAPGRLCCPAREKERSRQAGGPAPAGRRKGKGKGTGRVSEGGRAGGPFHPQSGRALEGPLRPPSAQPPVPLGGMSPERALRGQAVAKRKVSAVAVSEGGPLCDQPLGAPHNSLRRAPPDPCSLVRRRTPGDPPPARRRFAAARGGRPRPVQWGILGVPADGPPPRHAGRRGRRGCRARAAAAGPLETEAAESAERRREGGAGSLPEGARRAEVFQRQRLDGGEPRVDR